jgi:hypothetical protein
MVNWRNLEAAVDQRIGRTFGESVRLSFLKDGVVDPDRDKIDITATLATGGDDSATIGDGVSRYRSRLSLGQAELFIDRSSYDGPMPRTGDKVRANDRAGKPWFEVSSVSDRYSNLIVLSLGEV